MFFSHSKRNNRQNVSFNFLGLEQNETGSVMILTQLDTRNGDVRHF